MAFKLLSLYSLMGRKKPKEDTDELAIVKAAAWAWYQHGSGSEGKAMSEFDVKRTQREARPSRYKLEAMRMAMEAKEGSPIHTKKLSLLDTHEVQSISRQLDRLIESNHNKHGDGNNSENSRRMKKKRIGKGFLARHGVVCGRGEDVVHGNAVREHELSAKNVPAINLVRCLPRANSAAL